MDILEPTLEVNKGRGCSVLKLISGILSSDRACFLQQTLVIYLQILLSPLTLIDVFTLTLRDSLLSSQFSSFNSVTLLEQARLSL